MIGFGIILLTLACIPTCISTFTEAFEDNDLSANVNFERDFVERLNVADNKTSLDILEGLIDTFSDRYKKKKKTDAEFFRDFARQISTTGVKHLNNVATTIQRIMKVQSENNSPMSYKYQEEILKTYTSAIKYEYNYTIEHYRENFDWESILLNFIEEVNENLFTKKMLLLKHYSVYNIGKMSRKWSTINEFINFDYMEQKHQYLQELCYKRAICKSYPGFVDFLAVLIDDVISLPQSTFISFMLLLKQLVVEHQDFFESVIREKDLGSFSAVMDNLKKGEANNTKDLLRQVRDYIKDRLKLVKSTDLTLKGKTKAMRILMEIINKVFEKDGHELTRITFSNVRSALKASSRDNIVHVKKVLADFLRHSLIMCDSQWGGQTREEVMTLIEGALRGSSLINPELLKDLFESGSEFLQREPVDLYML